MTWALAFDATLVMDDQLSSGFPTEVDELVFKREGQRLKDRLQAELGARSCVTLVLRVEKQENLVRVGFTGGSTLFELGTVSDMVLFFDCIRLHATPAMPEAHRALIDDRLFRRYLRSSELDVAAEMLGLVKEKLTTLPVSSIDWAPEGRVESMLDRTAKDLASLFGRYFEAYDRCSESARLFLETFNIEQPVRVIRSDTAWFAWEKRRPLEAYEALDGPPFWVDPTSEEHSP